MLRYLDMGRIPTPLVPCSLLTVITRISFIFSPTKERRYERWHSRCVLYPLSIFQSGRSGTKEAEQPTVPSQSDSADISHPFNAAHTCERITDSDARRSIRFWILRARLLHRTVGLSK